MKPVIVIKPTAVFDHPNNIVAGKIISAPRIFPKGIDVQVYCSSREVKNIQIQSLITTSPSALLSNLHGFVYKGDVISTQDIIGNTIITNALLKENTMKGNIDNVIDALMTVRERPKIFIGSENPKDLLRFIYGFEYAISTFGLRVARHHGTHYHNVITERGWRFNGDWPIEEMVSRNMSDTEIIDEILQIEIETLKRELT